MSNAAGLFVCVARGVMVWFFALPVPPGPAAVKAAPQEGAIELDRAMINPSGRVHVWLVYRGVLWVPHVEKVVRQRPRERRGGRVFTARGFHRVSCCTIGSVPSFQVVVHFFMFSCITILLFWARVFCREAGESRWRAQTVMIAH